MADENVIRQGQAAGQLLKSDAFVTTMEGLRADITAKWAATQPADVDAREEYYYLMLAFGHLKARLGAMEQNGRFEQKKLDEARPRPNVIDFSQQ